MSSSGISWGPLYIDPSYSTLVFKETATATEAATTTQPTTTAQPTTTTAPDVTSTTTQTFTVPRNNLGPLTTVFNPGADCKACWVNSWDAGRACAAYSTDCHGPRTSCVPDNASMDLWAFYSPGLLCPSGWTTATVISANMTDSAKVTELFGGISQRETAAFCCPMGFTFTNGVFIPSTRTGGPQCVSTMTEGDFVFNICDVAGDHQLRTAKVGTSTFTTQFAWTSVREETFQWGPTTTVIWTSRTWTFVMVSTTTTTAQRDAVTVAPAIQLVWRPEDLSLVQTATVRSSSTGAGSATGQGTGLGGGPIAGIAVGMIVLVVGILFGIFMCIRSRRRRRNGVVGDTIETAKAPADGVGPFGLGGGLEPGQKAELDATSAAVKTTGTALEKQELPASPVVPPAPPRFELDATPVVRELPVAEESLGVPAIRTPSPTPSAHTSTQNVPVSPVSHRSTPQSGFSAGSPPSVLSNVGGRNGLTPEGWRVSILEE